MTRVITTNRAPNSQHISAICHDQILIIQPHRWILDHRLYGRSTQHRITKAPWPRNIVEHVEETNGRTRNSPSRELRHGCGVVNLPPSQIRVDTSTQPLIACKPKYLVIHKTIVVQVRESIECKNICHRKEKLQTPKIHADRDWMYNALIAKLYVK